MEIERIPSSDINRRLKEILERVAKGESFLLTRYGKDVAYLTNADEGHEEIMDQPTKTVIYGSPPKTAQNARDELLNRIRSNK